MKYFTNCIAKKSLIYFLVLSIILSFITVGYTGIRFTAQAETATPVWDGKTDTNAVKYDGGTGTETDPFLISNGNQLYKMVAENNTSTIKNYFKLTADIYLNDVSLTPIADVENPNVWFTSKSYDFAGRLDGDGNTVYGIYAAANVDVGLFPNLRGATVKNLKISKSYFEGKNAGSVAGSARLGAKSTISNCVIDETVTIKGSASAGGFAGYVSSTQMEISNSCSMAVLTSDKESVPKAGFVASTGTNNSSKVTVKNSWAIADKTVLTNGSAVVSETACYAVTEDKAKGEEGKSNMPDLDWAGTWIAGKSYPQLVTMLDNVISSPWGILNGVEFEGGDGTEQSPYLISTPQQLYLMVLQNGVNDGSTKKYFKLISDIYINDTTKSDWQTNKPYEWYTSDANYYFNDCLEGSGFTIYGLYSKKSGTRAGLFPQLTDGAVVQNVKISNAVLKNAGRSGGIAGGICTVTGGGKESVTISGCAVENADFQGSYSAGGLVGFFTSACTMENCYFKDGTLSSKASGGLIGEGWGATVNIKKCYSVGCYPVYSLSKNIKYLVFSNVYTNVDRAEGSSDALSAVTGFVGDDEDKMQGEAAKDNMSGFNFFKHWETSDGYPLLRQRTGPANSANSIDSPWGDVSEINYDGGDGTEDSPYLISTPQQLYRTVAQNCKDDGSEPKYFQLKNDIYINDVTNSNWTTNKPNQWFNSDAEYYFNDHFEGCGYTIYGLYSNVSGPRAGLFPQLSDGAVVQNVRISDAVINNAAKSGAVAGAITSLGNNAEVTVFGCGVENSSLSGKDSAGGLIGAAIYTPAIVENCYFKDGTLDSKMIGGIVAEGWGSSTRIKKCYSIGYYPTSGLEKNTKYFALSDVYTNISTAPASGLVLSGVTSYCGADEAKMKGTDAKKNMTGFDFKKFWCTDSEYPLLVKRTGNGVGYDTKAPGEVWSGNVSRNFKSGSGTQDDPYLIETAGQLAKLVKEGIGKVAEGKYYKLVADIILNDTSTENWTKKAHQWYSVGAYGSCFKGHFDGNGHTVSGMYVNIKSEGNNFTGLFPVLGPGAVVENVGIVNSKIVLDGTGEMHAGAISGFINIYNIDEVTEDKYPRVSQCFGDSTVNIEAKYCGGIVGSAGRPMIIENCFFTGDTSSYNDIYGAILGYTWMSNEVYAGLCKISNCYAAKQTNGTKICKDINKAVKYTNCYSSGPQDNEGVTRIYVSNMRNDTAKQYMPELDYENIWITRNNETPGLRIFADNAYVNTNDSDHVSISFVTNCDLEIPPIQGRAYESATLPTPTRVGYKFEGWYAYSQLDVPFRYNTFLSYDVTVFAKWSNLGLAQGFEKYPNTSYDLGDDYVFWRPSAANYDPKYVRNGARSMHRLGKTNDESDFLLFYEEELEVGKEYTMTFWATTDQQDATADVSIVHSTWPDIAEPNLGVEKIATLSGLTDGRWKQYTCTFVAKTKWISIRTTGGNSLYFDDFYLLATGQGVLTPGTGDKTDMTLLFSVFVCAVFVFLVSSRQLYILKRIYK